MFTSLVLSLALLAGDSPSPANLDAFFDRTIEWSESLQRIYHEHPRDTWLQRIRQSRTMAKADSEFVDWMDANPAIECYQPLQSKLRTRVVNHVAILALALLAVIAKAVSTRA